MDNLSVVEADLGSSNHQQAIIGLLNRYAADPIIDGKPLDTSVTARLIEGLQRHPTTIVFLAFAGTQPIGLATCFVGFSTFAAKPLINIHDLAVDAEHRGQGVGKRLLMAIEAKAQELSCCKLTLEVYEDNNPAYAVYEKFGFEPRRDHAPGRPSHFLAKKL